PATGFGDHAPAERGYHMVEILYFIQPVESCGCANRMTGKHVAQTSTGRRCWSHLSGISFVTGALLSGRPTGSGVFADRCPGTTSKELRATSLSLSASRTRITYRPGSTVTGKNTFSGLWAGGAASSPDERRRPDASSSSIFSLPAAVTSSSDITKFSESPA